MKEVDLLFELYTEFYRVRSEEQIYLEHKTDSYKNNKRKLATYYHGYIYQLKPYNNHPYYGFEMEEGKSAEKETVDKYWKEITTSQYFEKEITHIPV